MSAAILMLVAKRRDDPFCFVEEALEEIKQFGPNPALLGPLTASERRIDRWAREHWRA